MHHDPKRPDIVVHKARRRVKAVMTYLTEGSHMPLTHARYFEHLS